MQTLTVTKSKFKPQALAYLRMVEKEKKELVITHGGKPAVKVIPYREESKKPEIVLLGTVASYINPTEPVAEEAWEGLK